MNGVSMEGLGLSVFAFTAMVAGFVIGFYYSWQTTLVAIAFFPILAITGAIDAQIQTGL